MIYNDISSSYSDCIVSNLRNKNLSISDFRTNSIKLSEYIVTEILKDEQPSECTINTPIEACKGYINTNEYCIIPILRAGLSMLEPFLKFIPNASVGFICMARNEETAEPITKYVNIPNIENKTVIILDPMLATGGSAKTSILYLLSLNPSKIIFANIVAAPEGIKSLIDIKKLHLYTTKCDRELNHVKYIMPGLGDFGDRYYGT